MSVKVQDFSPQVISTMKQRGSLFLRMMSENMVTSANPVTPKKTGRLRMDVIKQVLGLKGEIRWGKNYAAIREKVEARNYTTPGTHAHYAEEGVRKGAKNTSQIAKRAGLA
jgi:hypothetical protein